MLSVSAVARSSTPVVGSGWARLDDLTPPGLRGEAKVHNLSPCPHTLSAGKRFPVV